MRGPGSTGRSGTRVQKHDAKTHTKTRAKTRGSKNDQETNSCLILCEKLDSLSENGC